jgi:hypothetical protein
MKGPGGHSRAPCHRIVVPSREAAGTRLIALFGVAQEAIVRQGCDHSVGMQCFRATMRSHSA